jgi:ribonuclease Z
MSIGMLTLAGTDIDAVSVGGIETCIALPGWQLCFDIGRCPPTAVRLPNVLITHAHMDHAGGIAYHAAMRDLFGMKPANYFVPRANAPDFERLFEAWRALDRSDVPATLVPCGPGDRVPLGGDRHAIPFRAPHRVVAQGYALVRARTRLRPELAGRPQEDVRRLRLAGELVTETHDVVEVAFSGDSTIDIVDREPLVRTARLLILEVTFYDDRVPVAAARGKGHVHLDEVIERTALFENEAILFTHASARYPYEEILRILDRRLPPDLRARVTALPPVEGLTRVRGRRAPDGR